MPLLKALQMGKLVAIADISRLKNEKIVEHWYVIKEIAVKAANGYLRF